MKIKKQRESYLIKPDFQWRIISYTAILSAVLILVIYLANTFFITTIGRLGVEAGLPPSHSFFLFLNEQSSLLDKIFIGIAVFTNLIIILGGLWLSNRIAGPIYRIESCLKKINSGEETTPVAFRKNDFFQELILQLNELIQNFNELRQKNSK